jgi:hypothetical protein
VPDDRGNDSHKNAQTDQRPDHALPPSVLSDGPKQNRVSSS